MPFYGQAPLQVTFTDTSTPTGDITYWHWDFGDGDTSDEQNPVHLYSAEGAYTVVLNIASPKGMDTFSDIVYAADIRPTAYWKLGESSGSRADSTASNFDLTPQNNPSSGTGVDGNAALFVRANSQYLIRTANGGELYPQGDFSFDGWIYPTGVATIYPTPEPHAVFSKDSGSATDRPYAAWWYPTYNILRFMIYGSDSSSTGVDLTGVTPNTWHHFAVVYRSSDKLVRARLNAGTEAVASSAATANPPDTGLCNFGIGVTNETGIPARFFEGKIDEVGFYSRALSDYAIVARYGGGIGNFPY